MGRWPEHTNKSIYLSNLFNLEESKICHLGKIPSEPSGAPTPGHESNTLPLSHAGPP